MAARRLMLQGKEWGWSPGRAGFQIRPPAETGLKSMYFDLPDRGHVGPITPGSVRFVALQLLAGKERLEIRQLFHGHVEQHAKDRQTCSKDPGGQGEHCSDWPEYDCCWCNHSGHNP